MKALLGTHMLLWWHCEPGQLSQGQRKVIEATAKKVQLLVSDISVRGMAMLHGQGPVG